VSGVVEAIRTHLDPAFAPRRALDFGCGVGRLVIPLAQMCDSVTGIDVSPGMLAEATQNVRREGIENTSFVRSDDELTDLEGSFDFIHSYIVFQHIQPERGERILRALLSRLEIGGFGALQFVFNHDVVGTRRYLIDAYRRLPLLYILRSIAKREDPRRPMMEMNAYDLNRVLSILRDCAADRVVLQFTETSHFGARVLGAFVLFQKVGHASPWCA
jgi:SAM-dependent methyltransferase